MSGRATHATGDASTSVTIGCLDAITAGPHPLVVDETTGALAEALRHRGATPRVWCRRVNAVSVARDWPESQPCSSAFIRLPKEKASLDMALHASAALVPACAPIVVFGGNDEGVRSAGRHLEAVADDMRTLDTRRHARVWIGDRRAVIDGLRPSLADWREALEIGIAGTARSWVTYPGLFARGRVDDGTALLVANLPDLGALPKSAPILDLACGTGVIAAELAARAPSATLHLVDNDAVAVTAARANVPSAAVYLGDGLASAPAQRYAMIVSNPPIHVGIAESHAFLHALAAEASQRLVGGGVLQIVVQRRVQALPVVAQHLREVQIVADDGRFQVLRGFGGRSAFSRPAAH